MPRFADVSMRVAGIDVGSRSIELVVVDGGEVVERRRGDTTFDPVSRCRELLDGVRTDSLVATGYGRRLVAEHFSAGVVTEIQAYALGGRLLFPQCRSILDIGGQDTKAIALDAEGKIGKFEMNDRCAAGTGKFLEFMAGSFRIPIEEFGAFALEGKPGLKINSMCTVFAETEATSLMARGHRPEDIALALHASVFRRSISMLKRVSSAYPLVFAGGVAKNPCMASFLRAEFDENLLVPDEPDMVGALGAAVHALKDAR